MKATLSASDPAGWYECQHYAPRSSRVVKWWTGSVLHHDLNGSLPCDIRQYADFIRLEIPLLDDDEPVTEDWLFSVGFIDDDGCTVWPLPFASQSRNRHGRLAWYGQVGYFGIDGVEVEAWTRGEVRRLLAALSVHQSKEKS